MCDKELLVAYLYDEIGDADRTRVDAHLRTCGACRAELTAMRGLRADLTSWSPPEPDFGFRIVREPPRAPLGWRARVTPALGLAAAATLVLAAATAVANLQVHYGADGLTVRTGWSSGQASAVKAAIAPAQPAVAPVSVDAAALQTIDRRLAGLEQFEKSAQALPVRQASAVSSRQSDAEMLQQIRALIAQSENRQQTMLARQIEQVNHDVDMKRATDLARVQQAFNYIDSKTASDAVMHRQLADMIRVVNQK